MHRERRIHLFVKMRLCETCALLGVLFLTIFEASDCLQTVVRPNKGSEVTVSTALPLDQCAVCRVSGVNDTETSCSSSITLTPKRTQSCCLTAPSPLNNQCTKDACSITAAEAQPSLLTEFARTFTWQLKAPEKTVVSLNILGQGLMETSQPCTNGLQYLVVTTETSGEVRTQYCQDGGSVTLLDLPNQAAVSVQVKPKSKMEALLFQVSAGPLKGRKLDIDVTSSTTVVFTRDAQGPECEVCTVDGSTTPNCNPTEQTLSSAEKHSLEFSCPKPQEMYNVKMTMKIECTKTSCTPAAGEVDPNPLKDFKRSLKWDISVPERTVLTLDFPGGLKEMSEEKTAKTVISTHGGHSESQSTRGVSDTGFITASYPADFLTAADAVGLHGAGMHNYSMHFNDHTARSASAVMGGGVQEEKKVTKLTLTDPQPQHQQGNFNMVLKNC
ncbi:hypothetical protein INR49_027304 [Caranx melampygus]|nr:hypothetical protein INR49_027304 [Caranx melampygus]